MTIKTYLNEKITNSWYKNAENVRTLYYSCFNASRSIFSSIASTTKELKLV